LGNTKIKVVAGEAYGKKAVVNTTVPILYLDVHAEKGADFTLDIPKEMNAMCYLYRGSAVFGSNEKIVKTLEMVTFEHDGNSVRVQTQKESTKFLVLAGVPLNEPIARYGPFVMNTMEEIIKAFVDYQSGNFVQHKAEMKSKTFHQSTYDPLDNIV